MTNEWLKSKPEVKVQYGGRLFLKTGSNNMCPCIKVFRRNFIYIGVQT